MRHSLYTVRTRTTATQRLYFSVFCSFYCNYAELSKHTHTLYSCIKLYNSVHSKLSLSGHADLYTYVFFRPSRTSVDVV